MIPFFEQVEARLGDLPADRAAELCVEAADAYKILENSEKSVAALKRTRELLPNDLEYAERYAAAVLDSGDAAAAERQYERIIEQFVRQLDTSVKVRLLLAYADAQLAAKRGKSLEEITG